MLSVLWNGLVTRGWMILTGLQWDRTVVEPPTVSLHMRYAGTVENGAYHPRVITFWDPKNHHSGSVFSFQGVVHHEN